MSRAVTRMTIHDALHYTKKQREDIIQTYPKHVRQSRTLGRPSVGEGAVFPIDDDEITCAPFDIPPHWTEIGGLDFGYDHPTAAIRMAFDRETETFYVTQEYRKRMLLPLIHCDALKGWGRHLPFAWGAEGLQVKLSDDPKQTVKIFKNHGLRTVDVHATFSNGGVGVERGVTEIYELMMSGRFKVFNNCYGVLEEKSSYHRKRKADLSMAQIVKSHDDLLDAMRYAYMMFRFAVPVSWRKKWGGRPNPKQLANRKLDNRDIFNRDSRGL